MKKTSRRGVKLGKSEGAPIVYITIEKLIIEIVWQHETDSFPIAEMVDRFFQTPGWKETKASIE